MTDQLKAPSRALEIKPVYEYLLLSVITFAAGALRLFKLGEWSFWGDEIFSFGTKPDGFIQSFSSILIRATTTAFGTSEWSARLVPALIGTFSVPLIYFPMRRRFGSMVALIAAALLAVSTWHLYWSQNARFYVLLLLFYTFSLLMFFFGLEEDNPWFMLASLVLFGLAAVERLLALFFLPVIISYPILLWLLPFKKPPGLRLRNLAIFFLPAIVIGLFFAVPFLRNISGWFVGFGRINNNPFWLLGGSIYYLGVPTVVIGTFGAIYFLIKKNRAALFLGLGASVPFLGILVISLFMYSANRYLFVSLSSWIFLASMAMGELFKHIRGAPRLLAAGVVTLLLVSPLSEDILYFRYQNGNRDDWRAAFEFVGENKGIGDVIVSTRPEVGNYYLGETTAGFNYIPIEQVGHYKRVWFVVDSNADELFPGYVSWLEKNARIVANYDIHANARLFKMRVYLHELSSGSGN